MWCHNPLIKELSKKRFYEMPIWAKTHISAKGCPTKCWMFRLCQQCSETYLCSINKSIPNLNILANFCIYIYFKKHRIKKTYFFPVLQFLNFCFTFNKKGIKKNYMSKVSFLKHTQFWYTNKLCQRNWLVSLKEHWIKRTQLIFFLI